MLGALLAGIVLRAWTRRFNMDTVGLEHKFDAGRSARVNQPEIGEFTDAPTSVGASSWPS
jgi:hypothetical protein